MSRTKSANKNTRQAERNKEAAEQEGALPGNLNDETSSLQSFSHDGNNPLLGATGPVAGPGFPGSGGRYGIVVEKNKGQIDAGTPYRWRGAQPVAGPGLPGSAPASRACTHLNLRTPTSQKCEAVLGRARI